jgi:CheY-like chemotaxis protein
MSAMDVPRILVVEDEEIVAASLVKRLRSLGYEVVAHATSGGEAVEQAAQLRPDLVLMDVRLKGPMDGVEAAALIQSHQRIPVVFLTAYSNKDVQDRAELTEPYGYILKPFDEREMHGAIETALHKHRMKRELQEREE